MVTTATYTISLVYQEIFVVYFFKDSACLFKDFIGEPHRNWHVPGKFGNIFETVALVVRLPLFCYYTVEAHYEGPCLFGYCLIINEVG